ncbi:MAG: hypothetical protein CL910_03140 [Deltaproteobacteria bacterium]|nr:hypothetical protein [Deltaproteobacteria bacterium]
MESAPGKGARFLIELPVAEGGIEEPSSGPAPASTRTAVGTILVVEDEAAIRRMLDRALSRTGHEVLTASDGATALERARGRDLDLVISDVMLGGERGPAIVDGLLAIHPDARVIYISGYADAGDLGIPDGVPLVAKPFAMAEVEAVVQRLIASRRGCEALRRRSQARRPRSPSSSSSSRR